MIFAKRPTPIPLVRLFVSCRGNQLSSVEKSLGELLLWALNKDRSRIKNYSINFGRDVVYKGAVACAEKIKFATLESVLFFADDIGVAVSCTRIYRSDPEVIFELLIAGSSEVDLLSESSALPCLGAELRLVYGYARALPADHEAYSEMKLKKSLFGTTSVGGQRDEWMVSIEESPSSPIRGIYPRNFWVAQSLEYLKQLPLILPVENTLGEGITEFADMGELRRLNPSMCRFIHD